MRLYSFLLLVLLLLFINNVASRKLSHFKRHFIRDFWDRLKDKIKDKTTGKFSLDFRQFDKEAMLLFPDIGFQSLTNDSVWNIIIRGWRFEGSKGKNWFGFSAGRWIERIAKQVVDKSDLMYLNASINHDRLKPFFVEDESNEKITIKIGDKTLLVKTDQQGQFYAEIQISNDAIQKLKQQQQQQQGSFITYDAIGDNKDEAKGVIQLIEPRQGITVISDIDDTIKISEVLDKVRLLANTFIHPFKPVPGMAELYQKWRLNNNNCTFHYLSGMPDQLYTLTQEFISNNNFPDGSFHMRHFGWAASSIFSFLHSQSTFMHKTSNLHVFLANTVRDYVLVGDSGEKDPEIYATVTKQYPERIRAIFIRAIKGESFDDQRFQTAFEGIPKEKWQIFNDPQQLPLDLSRSPGAASG
ncbi:unnamed protein product [Rotaria magnacalcarata]|uniref:Phosphatidate phosphatase APP1 catalytic domain-containing protein n=1 Tax=Rotaria magnacalcarata TaxID=392030 RepID=A0A815Q126_9BILA|nr:unnamed protein product [Rotaria magnacalcarata]CAF1664618.1 unnamed protein product [Rotaria magnacalcarata]CAF2182395.1 unnamed protein product [Rotaria magnacalcarata]CAF3816085.1 unnamed protein product [Rotaria magnacalcarata]CAF4030316.1 unnamed protein product [Rotaria magnacalcarata]